MPLCRRCERVVVKDCELYCGRQCAGAAVGDARWHSLPPTTHALQRGEHALVHFPGQDGGPRGDNYYDCVIRDFKLGHPLTDSKIRIWVLPVDSPPYAFDGYSTSITVEGSRGNEL